MLKDNNGLISLGEFKVESGKLFISDPCYKRDIWCASAVSNTKKGTWEAYIETKDEGEWGERISGLYAIHTDYSYNEVTEYPDCDSIINLGVDSGQLGIFDYEHFRDDQQFDIYFESKFVPNSECENEGDKFYGACCDITLSKLGAGVIPYGCVSSSGYGDGMYYALIYFHNNEVVAVKVVFIDEYDDEDEDDEYEE